MATLMYRSHPDSNALGLNLPTDVALAAQRRYELRYQILLEMHQTVGWLAAATERIAPDYIPFFATGGIPYVFPLMDVLRRRRRYDLVDGFHFHMFPGLAWGGSFNGQASLPYFSQQFGPLLAERLSTNRACKILSIDTTNTGHSTQRFVKAMAFLCSQHGLVHPNELEVSVVAILNGSHGATDHTEGLPVVASGRTAAILCPQDFTPIGVLRNKRFVRFVRRDGNDRFSLRLAVVVAGDIPTEDNAELLGVHAHHAGLGVSTDSKAGRIVVAFDNELSAEISGRNTTGHTLISLLGTSRTTAAWRALRGYADMAIDESLRTALHDATVRGVDAVRLWELMNDVDAPGRLHRVNRLLSPVEVYWLATQAVVHLKLLPKVIASVRRDKEIGPDAITFFRRCRPDVTRCEKTSAISDLLGWWIAELERLDGGEWLRAIKRQR